MKCININSLSFFYNLELMSSSYSIWELDSLINSVRIKMFYSDLKVFKHLNMLFWQWQIQARFFFLKNGGRQGKFCRPYHYLYLILEHWIVQMGNERKSPSLTITIYILSWPCLLIFTFYTLWTCIMCIFKKKLIMYWKVGLLFDYITIV